MAAHIESGLFGDLPNTREGVVTNRKFGFVLLLGLLSDEEVDKGVDDLGGNPRGAEGDEYGIGLKLGREQLGEAADVFVVSAFFVLASLSFFLLSSRTESTGRRNQFETMNIKRKKHITVHIITDGCILIIILYSSDLTNKHEGDKKTVNGKRLYKSERDDEG